MKCFLVALACLLALTACENINIHLAAEAGLDAVKAATLSDEDVQKLAARAAQHADHTNDVAPPESTHAKRLHRLVGDHLQEDGQNFNFKVYLSQDVNAFAMADGTIRIYSGLMDMLDDQELLFVIGHEMGHVAKRHIRKKMLLAYAGSALRKAIASQNNLAGDISRSMVGGFTETLLNAQFSQQEEREADDYGFLFLTAQGYDKASAVSALRKLATLGNNHSFLSSHPAPDARANRMEKKLYAPDQTTTDSLFSRLMAWLKELLSTLLQRFLP